jgi:nucleoid-associated protein YgaU
VVKPAAAQTTAEVAVKYYTVKTGDTLWGIASAQLGNGDRWTELWELNKTALIERDSRNATSKGRWVYPGMVLRLP